MVRPRYKAIVAVGHIQPGQQHIEADFAASGFCQPFIVVSVEDEDALKVPLEALKHLPYPRFFTLMQSMGLLLYVFLRLSMGWFYGFKLHLIINYDGQIIAFALTPGNVDDHIPLPSMTQRVFGKLFGDKIHKRLF